MEVWFAHHWFDLLQTIGIVAGLFFTGYAVRRDEAARRIGNVIAVKQQYRDIWAELYDRPNLFRVLKHDADLAGKSISVEESLFVKMLLLHLDTVHRAMKAGLFTEIRGMRDDIAEFIQLPIPKKVWEDMKPFQDADFVKFVEDSQFKH